MRGGRTVKISIYDVVVGDVIPLRIGDQVGLFSQYISTVALIRINLSLTYCIHLGPCGWSAN